MTPRRAARRISPYVQAMRATSVSAAVTPTTDQFLPTIALSYEHESLMHIERRKLHAALHCPAQPYRRGYQPFNCKNLHLRILSD